MMSIYQELLFLDIVNFNHVVNMILYSLYLTRISIVRAVITDGQSRTTSSMRWIIYGLHNINFTVLRTAYEREFSFQTAKIAG